MRASGVNVRCREAGRKKNTCNTNCAHWGSAHYGVLLWYTFSQLISYNLLLSSMIFSTLVPSKC